MSVKDETTVSVLSTLECHELLRTRTIGRLGVFADHYPLIIPVNYAMDREVVVIRSKPGTKLSHAVHENVSFEVDEIDDAAHTGWSVLLRGVAEEVTREHSAELIRRTESTGLEPWVPGEEFHWVRIIPHGISGRRICTSPLLDNWQLGTAAYM